MGASASPVGVAVRVEETHELSQPSATNRAPEWCATNPTISAAPLAARYGRAAAEGQTDTAHGC